MGGKASKIAKEQSDVCPVGGCWELKHVADTIGWSWRKVEMHATSLFHFLDRLLLGFAVKDYLHE